MSIEKMAGDYISSATNAAETMFSNRLYGYFLVVIYSTFDTLGLLAAPSGQVTASSNSFMAWVERYFLLHTDGTYNAKDLWAARCAILHTFTTESVHSRSGRARQLQYFLADKNRADACHFIAVNNQIDGGAHIAVHLGDFGKAFVKSMHEFAPALLAECSSNSKCADRLKNVLQLHPMDPAP